MDGGGAEFDSGKGKFPIKKNILKKNLKLQKKKFRSTMSANRTRACHKNASNPIKAFLSRC